MLNKYKYYLLTIILASCSISYELLLANTLSFITGNQILYQTLSIGIFILGLGFGSFVSDYYNKDSLKTIKLIEAGIVVFGFFSVSYLYFITMHYKFYEFFKLLNNFHNTESMIKYVRYFYLMSCELIVLLLGFLSGFEVPLIMKLSGKNENKILGLNYIGTLIGTLAFTYILNNNLNSNQIAVTLAFFNFIALLLIIDKKRYKLLATIGFCGLIYINLIKFKKIENNYYTLSYALFLSQVDSNYDKAIADLPTYPQLTRINSLYQKIDIINKPQDLTMFIDTNFQFSEKTESYYHQGFAHIPILLNNNIVPKKILILGAGDGLLLRELIKYPNIESITQVELDPVMIELATKFKKLVQMNENSLQDKRLHLLVDDGFNFVRTTKEKFDAVYIDFPYPKNHDVAKLYSYEFYSFVKNILRDNNSFVILDAPIIDVAERSAAEHLYENIRKYNDILLSSTYYAGFETMVPFRVDMENFLFLKIQSEKILKNSLYSTFFSPEVQLKINEIPNQKFDFTLNKKDINSVFKPKTMWINQYLMVF